MKSGKEIAMGVLLALTLAVIAFTGIASASNIYVSEDSSIQAAVNAAYPGDTIIVMDGTYTENVKVDKRLMIRSENGPDSTIVQADDPYDHVFEVTADYVKISGFTVTVEGADGDSAGIHLEADYCNISNNNCSNSLAGIALSGSSNVLSNNICSSNDGYGIILGQSSNNNTISNNICSNNNTYGFYIVNSNNNSISNNICSLNDGFGIWLVFDSNNNTISDNNCSNNDYGIGLVFDSNDNTISDNNCSNNDYGIGLGDSNNNSISNNNCSNNEDNGIWLVDSNDNYISTNNCSNNHCGIYLQDYSKNNSISNNNCTNNSHGIHLEDDSNNNHIYLNNFINNIIYNVYSYESTNTWNSPEKITYSYGRRTYTSCLGNYYDDYTGTDRNRDGIGDTPYQIDEDRDMYPLMEPGEKYFAPSERPSEVIYFILRWILED